MRRFTPLLAFLGVAAILAAFTGCGSTFSFLVPKAAIVKAVTGQFPTVKSQGVITLRITHPVLDFEGSKNRLGIKADVAVGIGVPQVASFLSKVTDAAHTEVTGYMLLDGTLGYQPESGTFVFTDLKVRKFAVDALPRSDFDAVAGMATSAVVNALGGLQLYKLDTTDWKQRLAKGVLRGITVTDDGVLVKFGL